MNIVLDTQALLVLYMGEKGAKGVSDILEQVLEGKTGGYMNVVNLAELYYILARKSVKVAEEKEKNLRNYGVKIVPVEDGGLWKDAASLKARHKMSLADAFAAATARKFGATLVTGQDPDFDGIDGVRIERV